MEQVKLLMTELSPELTRLCAETLAAQDIAVTVCEKDGGGPPCGCTACGGRRVHRDGDPAPDRRACAHQGLPVPAGRHPDDNGKPGLYQQRYKAPVSGDRKAQRHHGQPCGAGHPPRH